MITSLSFDILIITYYAMFVNIFFASLRFLLLASRFVKRKSPCLLNVRYFLLLVFILITTFPLSCIYYIILLRICQGFFKTFFKFLKPYYEGGILDASALPFPLDNYNDITQHPKMQ